MIAGPRPQTPEPKVPLAIPLSVADGTKMFPATIVIDRVDYQTRMVHDTGLLIDNSPPICGNLSDGRLHHEDAAYWRFADEYCFTWDMMTDPHSSIVSLTAQVLQGGVGVSDAIEVTDTHRHAFCVPLNATTALRHNTTYNVKVVAINGGHRRLTCSSASSGMLVDLTVPNSDVAAAPTVNDNLPMQPAIKYSASASTAYASWQGFADPQSGVVSYDVQTVITAEDESIVRMRPVNVDLLQEYEAHHYHFQHRDTVQITVAGYNGAGGVSAPVSSGGFLVDLTKPAVIHATIGESPEFNRLFQSSADRLQVNFKFRDDESGIGLLTVDMYREHHKITRKLGITFQTTSADT